MKALQRLKVTSLLMTIVMLATLFVPVVGAKADISENKEYADAIDISKKISISEEEITKALKEVNVIKETDSEKIVSFKKEDGSIGYVVSWVDSKNRDRINFAFVDEEELVTSKSLSAAKVTDVEAVASTISAMKTSFWNGSYIETYGKLLTGGVHIYFSKNDASYVAGAGATAAAGIVNQLGKYIPYASAIAVVLALGIQTVYWKEKNSNGSLDVRIPYQQTALPLYKVKIGTHWYYI